MRTWWAILRKQWRLEAAALVLAALMMGAPVVLALEQSAGNEAAPTTQTQGKAGGEARASVVEKLQTLLRDKSKSAEDRVNEALRVLEEEKKAAPPSDEEVDRLPWLDEDWSDTDVWTPFGGRWDPWREMQEMRARMDRIFQQAWRRMNEQARQFGQTAGRFSPMGEFERTEDAYIYRFDLPGVNKDDVKVTVENGRLTIEGKRESRVDENRKGFARREIFYGHFRRDVALPPDADPAKAKTKLENGVLTIEVPRIKGASKSSKQELKIL